MTNVLCFGSINIDHVYSVNHIVQKGETILSPYVEKHDGGKGLNQAISLAKSGQKVYMAGGVGIDDGSDIISSLQKSGVDTSLIEYRSLPTGHAIIQVDIEGNNSIIAFGGANQQNSKEYITRVLNKFEGGDWIILQNEINDNEYIIEEAKKRNINICMNPSPFSKELAKLCDVQLLIVNEIEANALCKESDDNYQLVKLHKMYPNSLIVITLGDKGSVAIDKVGNKFKQNAYSCKVLDTTGAGDTFTGYFISEYLKTNNIGNALNMASAASAISVTKKGAASSIPFLKETEEFLINRRVL